VELALLPRLIIAAVQNIQKAKARSVLAKPKRSAISWGTVFAELVDTEKATSIGQGTNVLFEVGLRYQRSMQLIFY